MFALHYIVFFFTFVFKIYSILDTNFIKIRCCLIFDINLFKNKKETNVF